VPDGECAAGFVTTRRRCRGSLADEP
jgi:hypothetical protein